jgi:predicted acyl esterase
MARFGTEDLPLRARGGKRGPSRLARARRHSFSKARSARFVVLSLLVTSVAAPTSATAQTDDLQTRLMDQFFESGIDLASATTLFPACTTTNATPKFPTKYTSCTGEVRSWDGLELDARVTFPTDKPGPLPLVVLLHGWAGNRNGLHNVKDPETDAPWKPARFWAKGYATLVYTARGFGASCGATDPAADVNGAGGTDVPFPPGRCHPQGHTHLAERGFEVADTQHLLGLLVDAGVADPRRLAAAGGSYGGGQSWLLATAMPWATPRDKSIIQLAAAAPFSGWTDFYGSLAPNGRASDRLDQSASHEEPFGIVKQRFVTDTYRAGRVTGGTDRASLISGGRYNTTNPAELHSFVDGWMAAFNAGEPHDTDMAKSLPAALRGKSAYHSLADPQRDYVTQLAARRVRPVPIFAVQGWTDFVFPAVEALQMYRKLKAAHPGYPISLLLADLGHGSQNRPAHDLHAWQQAVAFIDSHLGIPTDGAPPVAASFPTVCPATDSLEHLSSDNWDTLVKHSPLTFPSDDRQQTDSSSSNAAEEAATDPAGTTAACIERPGDASASGAVWRWDVVKEFTMLGLPSVTLPYRMVGPDATVVAKLWDVGPEGPDGTSTKTLVTRGLYRLTAPAQPITGLLNPPGQTTSGVLEFQLFGNHWQFSPGHTIELELGQRDAPFLRPDNFSSTIAYDGVTLRVPEAKG